MKKTAKSERRLYPRIEHRIPLKVIANGYDFATSTENVSCVGAYCHINKYVPPFTKVLVKLTLPQDAKETGTHAQVECKGVVVRTLDEHNGGFNVAIFFNHINDQQKKKIANYLRGFLHIPSCQENSPARNGKS